jgi:hypothetical protein
MWVLGQHDTEAQHGTTARHGPIKANSAVLGLRRRPMCRPGTTRHLTVPCLGPSILARPMTGSGRAGPARPIGHVYRPVPRVYGARPARDPVGRKPRALFIHGTVAVGVV